MIPFRSDFFKIINIYLLQISIEVFSVSFFKKVNLNAYSSHSWTKLILLWRRVLPWSVQALLELILQLLYPPFYLYFTRSVYRNTFFVSFLCLTALKQTLQSKRQKLASGLIHNVFFNFRQTRAFYHIFFLLFTSNSAFLDLIEFRQINWKLLLK